MQRLLELLRNVDEISILELLDISTEDLLDAFRDRIKEKAGYLYGALGEEEQEL